MNACLFLSVIICCGVYVSHSVMVQYSTATVFSILLLTMVICKTRPFLIYRCLTIAIAGFSNSMLIKLHFQWWTLRQSKMWSTATAIACFSLNANSHSSLYIWQPTYSPVLGNSSLLQLTKWRGVQDFCTFHSYALRLLTAKNSMEFQTAPPY